MSNNSRTMGDIFIPRDNRPILDIDFNKPVSALTTDEVVALKDAAARHPKSKEWMKETPEKFYDDVEQEAALFKNFAEKRRQDVKTFGREVPESKLGELVRDSRIEDMRSSRVAATAVDALVEHVTRLTQQVENLEKKLR